MTDKPCGCPECEMAIIFERDRIAQLLKDVYPETIWARTDRVLLMIGATSE